MKKTILGLGSAAAIIAPIAGVVACGTSDEKEKEKTLKEILASKVLVLKTEDAVLSNAALMAAIKKQLEMDYGLELKKAHMLTVNADKSNGTTLAAIDVTTDETAKKAYVTVKVNDEEAKDDAKNIEIKVRKETAKAYSERIVSTLKEHIEKTYKEDADALDLTKSVPSGVSVDNAYTNAKFVVSLKAKLKAAPWSESFMNDWIDNATWEVKKYGTTAAKATGIDNTVSLSSATTVELEVSYGSGEDKAGPETISFKVKAV